MRRDRNTFRVEDGGTVGCFSVDLHFGNLKFLPEIPSSMECISLVVQYSVTDKHVSQLIQIPFN